MAGTQCIKIVSMPQGESLSGKLNHTVTVNALGQVILTDAVTDPIFGTVASDPGVDTVGVAVSIAMVNGSGVLKVVANAAITRGHQIVPTATDGKVSGVTRAALDAQQSMGFGLQAATAADEVIEVACHPYGPKS